MDIAVGLVPAQRLRLLGEHAAANVVPGFQSRDSDAYLLHGLFPLAFQQGLAQQVHFVFRFLPLGGGKQHFCFNEHQVGGHGNELAGDVHVQPLHLVQVGQILLQNGRNGHILNFDFVFA